MLMMNTFLCQTGFSQNQPATKVELLVLLSTLCLRRTNLENQWRAITENHTEVIENGGDQVITLCAHAATMSY